MRIAFTGTASTGKTTLINELFKKKEFLDYQLIFLKTDARSILDSMGFRQMDLMNIEQTQIFELRYFDLKKENETNNSNFITDRSFVDGASYWLNRDCANDLSLANSFINKSCRLSLQYDLHFYFPYGIIPFEGDGYRSENETLRKNIGDSIKLFLDDWSIKYIPLSTANLNDRVDIVLNELKKIGR